MAFQSVLAAHFKDNQDGIGEQEQFLESERQVFEIENSPIATQIDQHITLTRPIGRAGEKYILCGRIEPFPKLVLHAQANGRIGDSAAGYGGFLAFVKPLGST